MGVATELFGDFMLGTSETMFDGPRSIRNFATDRTFLLRRFLKGNPNVKIIQSGTDVVFYAMFDEASTAEDYLPGQKSHPQNPQVLERASIPWRYLRDHMSWNEKEVMLNEDHTEDARYEQWISTRYSKEMRLATSYTKKMESDLYRVPDASQMEDTKGAWSYSLFVFNNEFTNGLFPGWTTIETFDPAEFEAWRPQQQTYAQLPATPTNGVDWDLFKAFDTMSRLVSFESLPGKEEFSHQSSGQYFITTQGEGVDNYKLGARRANDHLRYDDGGHDPAVRHTKFDGIDIVYVATLDTVEAYPTGTAGALDTYAATANSVAGPRYHWNNGDHICPIYHGRKYMEKGKPMTHPEQPDTQVMWCDTWRQLLCDEIRSQGTVYPSATLS